MCLLLGFNVIKQRLFKQESFHLILGIDFTKSNEWTGKVSFNNRSLHAIGDTPNPYEKAIGIIGKTLAPFDDDNLIPCFGFGDATTHDQEVFSFHSDHTPCNGFEEVLACYRNIVPNLKLSGPTSYASVIDTAIDIVEKSGGQYHVLVIIADGQFVNFTAIMSKNNITPAAKEAAFALAALMEIPIQYKAAFDFGILG
ncbi:hypothetical protein LWI29_036311 [Acer saccharum]|uniref:Copine C-terminal domain-containing protein n=1 Tax=Acer saccharum TaxID=4024 RepID=A0AA39VTT4_ACESA|nr:hypothetical protein LWI29_036311 [Acer saccharum]